jgi:LysM repeat protein
MTALLIAVPVTVAACGAAEDSAATLPPIASTTTTTIALTTTTPYIPVTYEIQPGDRLGDIAVRFGVDRDALQALNGITNENHIEAGDILNIPPPTVPTTSTSTTTTSTTTTVETSG